MRRSRVDASARLMSGEVYRPLRPPALPFAASGSGGASASESLKSIVFAFASTVAVRVVLRGSP